MSWDRNIISQLRGAKAKEFDVDSFNKRLEDAYLTSRKTPHDKAKKSFAPSGIGYGSGKCPRMWYYNLSGGIMREDTPDAMGVATMAYGVEAHKRIQGLFKKADMLIAEEIKVTHNDPPIFGFVDVLVKWQDESVVGEIKTTSQESFAFRQTAMKPSGYHLLQVLIYMKVMGKDRGFILYENKNTHQFITFPVTWTEANIKLISDTFEWMQSVWDNVQNGGLPKRPAGFTKSSIPCKSCDFFKHCWNDSDGEVDLPALEVPK